MSKENQDKDVRITHILPVNIFNHLNRLSQKTDLSRVQLINIAINNYYNINNKGGGVTVQSHAFDPDEELTVGEIVVNKKKPKTKKK